MKRYGLKTWLLATWLLQALGIGAQTRTDTLRINHRIRLQHMAENRIGSFVYDKSPAAALFRHTGSLTEAAVEIDWRDEEEARIEAEGDGILKGVFRVESFIKLNEQSAAFAEVKYDNGVIRNVLWNSSSDHKILYPYLVADSVGGDLDSEQYYFSGGYTRRDGKVNYGISGSYRALHEYRQVDPRPRNQTSDLRFDLGAGYLLSHYSLSANFGIRIYKQDQRVSYYNENGVNTIQFHMLGLGAYHGYFSGSSDYALATNFKGTGYTATLVFAPRLKEGWSAAIRYDNLKTTQYLKARNNLPLTELDTETLTGEIAYLSRSAAINWGVEGKVEYQLRQGTESVADAGVNYENNVLTRFTMYRSHQLQGEVKGLVEWKGRRCTGALLPSIGYSRFSASYLYPHREMQFSWLRAGGEALIKNSYKHWLFETTFEAAYTPLLERTLELPLSLHTDPNYSIRTLHPEITHAFKRYTADYATGRIGFRSQYAINRLVAVFISADWTRHCYRGGFSDDIIAIAIGVNF